VQFI
jgi:hypothetical protein